MESASKPSDSQIEVPTESSADESRLTLIDSDPARATELKNFLVALGNRVVWARRVEEVLSQETPATGPILLAVDEARKGIDDCRLLRMSGVVLPILLMAADLPSESSLGEGLDAGIDDFLSCPLEPDNLVLRLRVVDRRYKEIVQSRIREDRLRTLEKALETVQLGVTITDIDGRIQYTNPADARMHGYRVDELLGQNVRVLAPLQTWRPMAPQDLREAHRWTRESINLRSDGTAFPVQLWSDVVDDSGGDPNCIITICQDLTERRKTQAALHQNEEQLAAARGANDGLWGWNLETDFIDYSPRWKAMLGFETDEIDGHIEDWLQRVHPDDRAGLEEDLERHIEGDSEYLENQHRVKHRDGRWLWMLCRGRAVRDTMGRAVSLAGSQIDITALKEAENALRKSELRFRSVAQSASDAIISTDDRGRIIFWNQSAEHLFGYDWQEIRNRPMSTLMPPNEYRSFLKQLESLVGSPQEDARSIELNALHRSGETLPVEASLASWNVGDNVFYSGIVRDIRERKAFEAKLVEMATHDSLTGLFNRRHLMESLAKLRASARRYRFPLTLCLCDLDRFKEINDLHGHQTGDRVLAEVGEMIADTVRDSDLCCRYGGDEICILFPYSTASDSIHAIRRIQNGLEELSITSPRGESIRVGISFGLVEMPTEDADETTILQLADQALYLAKDSESGFSSRHAEQDWWRHPSLFHSTKIQIAEISTGPRSLAEDEFNRELDREIHDASRHGHPLSFAALELRTAAAGKKNLDLTEKTELERLLKERLPRLLRVDDLVCRYGPGEFSVALPHTPYEQVEKALGRFVESILETTCESPGGCEPWFGVAFIGAKIQSGKGLFDSARRYLHPFPISRGHSCGESEDSAAQDSSIS